MKHKHTNTQTTTLVQARTVEQVVQEAKALRKENRGLEKKMSKLHVKRSKRGSSREVLEQLQRQIHSQVGRFEGSVGGFGWRVRSLAMRGRE